MAQFPKEQSADGKFQRQGDAFRNWVRRDGSSEFAAEAGRYHLYVSLACPWAHRTILLRTLKGLEGAIGMTVVDPYRDEKGWAFREGPGHSTDPINRFQFLSEAYRATDPDYDARVTVPVLWDTKTSRIVSNSDDDIMRMLNSEFDAFAKNTVDFYPADLRPKIDAINTLIYDSVNNGVYQAGIATSQFAYETAAYAIFDTLNQLEALLAERRYLFGDRQTESDWRLFPTLIRFDEVYHGHFKCNLRRLVDYPNLFAYVRDLYQQPGVAETVNFGHIKCHYYQTHDEINPNRIIPLGPMIDFSAPHGRENLVMQS
ncbi:MAG TPA: glutathione S-transferase family protein [Chthoniobacterales bacterium]|jgi:putative glutathione S-transferase